MNLSNVNPRGLLTQLNSHLLRFVLSMLCGTALSGCLFETETAITPDTKVDPQLEGVWQITPKLPGEMRGDRDKDDIGVYGYIIIAPMKKSDGTIDPTSYKALAFDSFKRDDNSNDFPEMFISTRRHNGHNLLLVRLADYEKKKAKKGETQLKNLVLDYEFNKYGELFLRFWFCDDFDELQKAHPMKFDHKHEPFAPITLKGDEAHLLSYYSDPKVRALLTGMGKYHKLMPLKIPQREQPADGKTQEAAHSPH